jgi:hypothetical protein
VRTRTSATARFGSPRTVLRSYLNSRADDLDAADAPPGSARDDGLLATADAARQMTMFELMTASTEDRDIGRVAVDHASLVAMMHDERHALAATASASFAPVMRCLERDRSRSLPFSSAVASGDRGIIGSNQVALRAVGGV